MIEPVTNLVMVVEYAGGFLLPALWFGGVIIAFARG